MISATKGSTASGQKEKTEPPLKIIYHVVEFRFTSTNSARVAICKAKRHPLRKRCLQYVKHNEIIVGDGEQKKRIEKAKATTVQGNKTIGK